MRTVLVRFVGRLARLGRSRHDLLFENFALPHQLAMCERRPRVTAVDRRVWTHLLRRWSGWRRSLIILVRCHYWIRAPFDVTASAIDASGVAGGVMLLVLRYVLVALTAATPDRRALALENIALRHQVEVLTRNPRRPALRPADRLLRSWLSRTWPDWRRHVVIVQPDTVVRWHRTAWHRYWRGKSRGGKRGRPRIEAELAALIRRTSWENPRWGHMRVLGELRKLGYRLSVQTVRRYRQDVPRDPASSGRTFLQNRQPQIWAADFFTVHTLGFQTLSVFFSIVHDRRAVMHVRVTAHPTAAWVWRQLINATPWGRGPRDLIRDRDRSYGGDFIARARRIGIETALTPIATPQTNGIAERLIDTLRRECLDHVIVVNQRHLQHVLRDFIHHDNAARPHQALDLQVPEAQSRASPAASRRIVSRPVLGGLTHEYEWEAA